MWKWTKSFPCLKWDELFPTLITVYQRFNRFTINTSVLCLLYSTSRLNEIVVGSHFTILGWEISGLIITFLMTTRTLLGYLNSPFLRSLHHLPRDWTDMLTSQEKLLVQKRWSDCVPSSDDLYSQLISQRPPSKPEALLLGAESHFLLRVTSLYSVIFDSNTHQLLSSPI